MSDWGDSLGDLKLEETPMVFLSRLLSDLDISKEKKIELAEAVLFGGEYELDFLFSFTAHLIDLMADIEQISRNSENKLEFGVSELMERTLELMGVDLL